MLASLSQFYDVEAVEFTQNIPIPGDLLVGLKVPFMRHHFWVPLREEDNKIVIAIDNPHDQQRIGEMRALFPGKNFKFCVALKQDILEIITFFSQDEKQLVDIEEILSMMRAESNEIQEAEKAVGEEDNVVVKLVNKFILDAYARGASDIHIEPFPGKKTPGLGYELTEIAWSTRPSPSITAVPLYPELKLWPIWILLNAASPRTEKSNLRNSAARILSCGLRPSQPRAAWKMSSCASWMAANPCRWIK